MKNNFFFAVSHKSRLPSRVTLAPVFLKKTDSNDPVNAFLWHVPTAEENPIKLVDRYRMLITTICWSDKVDVSNTRVQLISKSIVILYRLTLLYTKVLVAIKHFILRFKIYGSQWSTCTYNNILHDIARLHLK